MLMMQMRPYSSGESSRARTMLTKNDTPICVTLSMALHPTPLSVFFFNDSCDMMLVNYLLPYTFTSTESTLFALKKEEL